MSWSLGKVSDIADVISGYAFKTDCFGTGKDRIVKIGNLQNGRITDNDLMNFDSSIYKVSEQFKIQTGDILMALSGATVGKIAIAQEKDSGSYLNQRVAIVRGKSPENAKYLKYVFSGQSLQKLLLLAGGVAQPNLSPKSLADMEIPLPPLDEQKRIAAILDKADSLRRKRQQTIQLADEFLRAVFLDLFGDPVTNPKGFDEYSLMDIADIRSGVTKGKQIDLSKAITLPYMRVANVQDGYLDLSNIQQISVSPNDAKKCQLEKGDILLTEGGDPDKLGRGHIWNNEIENCIHQNHIFSVRIKEKEKIRPEFLNAVIASQRGKKYFLKVGKQTTGIATINKTVLSEFVPFIPPVEMQDKFVALATKIKRIKNKYSALDLHLFESLSQKAFAGEL